MFIQTKSFTPAAYANVKVGMKIKIYGHITPSKYTKDGETIYQQDIIADYIEYLESKQFSVISVPFNIYSFHIIYFLLFFVKQITHTDLHAVRGIYEFENETELGRHLKYWSNILVKCLR